MFSFFSGYSPLPSPADVPVMPRSQARRRRRQQMSRLSSPRPQITKIVDTRVHEVIAAKNYEVVDARVNEIVTNRVGTVVPSRVDSCTKDAIKRYFDAINAPNSPGFQKILDNAVRASVDRTIEEAQHQVDSSVRATANEHMAKVVELVLDCCVERTMIDTAKNFRKPGEPLNDYINKTLNDSLLSYISMTHGHEVLKMLTGMMQQVEATVDRRILELEYSYQQKCNRLASQYNLCQKHLVQRYENFKKEGGGVLTEWKKCLDAAGEDQIDAFTGYLIDGGDKVLAKIDSKIENAKSQMQQMFDDIAEQGSKPTLLSDASDLVSPHQSAVGHCNSSAKELDQDLHSTTGCKCNDPMWRDKLLNEARDRISGTVTCSCTTDACPCGVKLAAVPEPK